jgi:hypothetical protein
VEEGVFCAVAKTFMNPDFSDLRGSERYVVAEKLIGSFGVAEVSVLNIAEQGAQIEHAQPLRLATKGRLWFKRGDVAVSLHAIVVWSKLSKTPNDQGKYLYRSGLRVEETAPSDFLLAMQRLAEHGVIKRDDDSLNRKKRRHEERAQEKVGKPVMRNVPVESDISPDQVLLIQHARERLRANFDEAQKWYSRAYFALREGKAVISGDPTRYPEDVLAVWEYLERSIPLSTIKRVFDTEAR